MKLLLTIFCLLILVSCSKEIPSDQKVERNGITYEVNSQTPFTGTTTSFYENGQLKERLSYKEGMKNGIQETFFSNGQLESKEELLNGYRNVGTKSNYYWDGQLESRVIYSKGGDQVFSEYYYGNGQLVYKRNHDVVEPYVEFFSDGKVKAKSNLDKDGNGTREYYHENGQLWSKGNYKDGDQDGLWELFYENGQPKEKSNYKEGKLNGLQETYSNEGELHTKTNFKEGVEVGPRERYMSRGYGIFRDIGLRRETLNEEGKTLTKEEYYDNGQLSERINFNDEGKKEGLYERFEKSGTLRKRGSYENGSEVGIHYYYFNEDHSDYFKDDYKGNGRMIRENYKNGKLLETICYQDGNDCP